MKKRGGMTLAEHDAQLKAEGRYDAMVARRAEQDAAIEKREAEYRLAEEPLVADLRAVGFTVKSAWDLVNTTTPYPAALPILLKHLQLSYPAAVREGMARALAVPDAKFGWSILLKLYDQEAEKRVKDGLSCALAAASDDDVIGDVIARARDPRNAGRVLLLSALERSQDPRARATLMALGTDPDVYKEVEVILKRLKKKRS